MGILVILGLRDNSAEMGDALLLYADTQPPRPTRDAATPHGNRQKVLQYWIEEHQYETHGSPAEEQRIRAQPFNRDPHPGDRRMGLRRRRTGRQPRRLRH